MIEISAISNDGQEKSLTVSPSHGVVRVKKTSHGVVRVKKTSHDIEVVPATMIRVNDRLKFVSEEEVSFLTVTSSIKKHKTSKTILFTEDGTVLANGIHAATSCGVGEVSDLAEFKDKLKVDAANAVCFEQLMSDPSTVDKITPNMYGEVYASDYYEYIVQKCTGKSAADALNELLLFADHLPTSMSKDSAFLLNTLLNAEGIPSAEAINYSPYLCDDCADPYVNQTVLAARMEAMSKVE